MLNLATEVVLKGTPLSRGVAIGPLFFIDPWIEKIESSRILTLEEVAEEKVRFREALSKSRHDMERIKLNLENEGLSEGAGILEAHVQIMNDPGLTLGTERLIEQLKPAEMAFQRVVESYLERFEQIKNPFFKERAHDLRDIARRVWHHLREVQFDQWQNLPCPSIFVTSELSPTLVAEFTSDQVIGILTEKGSENSHAAILARAKGIPFISGISLHEIEEIQAQDSKKFVVMDAREGKVIFNPALETLEFFRETGAYIEKELEALKNSRGLTAETFDGYEVRLSANIDVDAELDLLHQYGGQGVGLFRSEYVFLKHEIFPHEEEQFAIYKDIVDRMKGLPLVIRTFDVGGDKGHVGGYSHHGHQTNSYPASHREDNPFLGCRAIRFLLREQTVFKTQLKAILRAAAYGEVSLMFPMVSGLSELKEAKKLLAQVEAELEKEGHLFKRKIRLGCMIEVPSAAIIADLIAKECDFLSIGTNDLVQYALAVDRGNELLSGIYTPTHPCVIRLIKMVVTEANRQGIPVSICGEIAADPRFTPLLLGLGVHELSVAARYIPTIKKQVRATSIVRAAELAEEVLYLGDPVEIAELLEREYQHPVIPKN